MPQVPLELGDRHAQVRYFRLYLHATAQSLLVRLHRAVARPPPPPTPLDATPANDVPTEALDGQARRRYFARRRQADRLGEGHPGTWRSLLIKVAAEVTVSTRRVLVRLSAAWPYRDWYRRRAAFLTSVRSIPPG